jgi:hypothetical protein
LEVKVEQLVQGTTVQVAKYFGKGKTCRHRSNEGCPDRFSCKKRHPTSIERSVVKQILVRGAHFYLLGLVR